MSSVPYPLHHPLAVPLQPIRDGFAFAAPSRTRVLPNSSNRSPLRYQRRYLIDISPRFIIAVGVAASNADTQIPIAI